MQQADNPQSLDRLGAPLNVGDSVIIHLGPPEIFEIEAIEPGGVYRDEAHRVLLRGHPRYVGLRDLIKVAMLELPAATGQESE